MKYLLIFWTFWVTPHPHVEGITAEGFTTMLNCQTFAESLWKIVQRDGAVSYKAICKPYEEVEV